MPILADIGQGWSEELMFWGVTIADGNLGRGIRI
jgi:hypothetical protein